MLLESPSGLPWPPQQHTPPPTPHPSPAAAWRPSCPWPHPAPTREHKSPPLGQESPFSSLPNPTMPTPGLTSNPVFWLLHAKILPLTLPTWRLRRRERRQFAPNVIVRKGLGQGLGLTVQVLSQGHLLSEVCKPRPQAQRPVILGGCVLPAICPRSCLSAHGGRLAPVPMPVSAHSGATSMPAWPVKQDPRPPIREPGRQDSDCPVSSLAVLCLPRAHPTASRTGTGGRQPHFTDGKTEARPVKAKSWPRLNPGLSAALWSVPAAPQAEKPCPLENAPTLKSGALWQGPCGPASPGAGSTAESKAQPSP